MAKKVKGFPEGTPRRNRNNIYHWDKWFDGNVWLLEQGKDYHSKTTSMRAMVAAQAKERGLRAQTKVVEDTIYIQAYKEGDE